MSAHRYSGFGSRGSRPRRGAKAAIRGNRSASGFSRKRSARRISRKPKDITRQSAVGGKIATGFHRSAR